MAGKYKGITLRVETVARLDAIKHQGQSYDGIINELVDATKILPPKTETTEIDSH